MALQYLSLNTGKFEVLRVTVLTCEYWEGANLTHNEVLTTTLPNTILFENWFVKDGIAGYTKKGGFLNQLEGDISLQIHCENSMKISTEIRVMLYKLRNARDDQQTTRS